MELPTQEPRAVRPEREPRRVLLFVYWLTHGGMEQQTINLARAYVAHGDEVTIGYVGLNTDPAPLSEAGIKLVDLQASDPVRRILSIPRFARLAREADIVHCTGWDASAWGRIAAWIARRPVVVTEHTSPGRETQTSSAGRSNAWLVSLHNRLLDPVTWKTVAVAEAQIARLEQDGVKPDKIQLIPNGVALEPIRRASLLGAGRAEFGIPQTASVVAHIGRFIPQKRQQWTYDAVKELRPELGDIHVIFAGIGPTREQLERQALEESADWAHFLGQRPDVPALLRLSDLAVLPSQTEALPMAMIEALALGIPQVATDAGDVRPVLESSGAGIVVGRDDRQGFIDACRRVLDDPDLAAQQSTAAVAAAEAFDVDVMAERYESLFDEAIAARRPRPRKTSSPRVLLTCDWFLKYGAGLAGGLAANGAEPVLLTRDHAQEFGGEIDEPRAHVAQLAPGVPLWTLPGRTRELGALPAMREIAGRRLRFEPTVIHLQESAEDDPRLLLLSGLRPGRYAYTVHDPVLHPGDAVPSRHAQFLRRRLLRHAGVVFVHAEPLREELLRLEDVRAPVVVVPHGADLAEPRPLPDNPSILFFGRISSYKGVDVMLDAMDSIWGAVPSARLVIAGDGELPEHPVLADERVEIRSGHVPESDVPDLFGNATIVALPYIQASQSGVGSLAKSHGRAMVVTSAGGLPELVSDGSGTVIAPRDSRALANAASELLGDPQRAAEMGRAGLRSARQGASWKAVGEATLEAYERYRLL